MHLYVVVEVEAEKNRFVFSHFFEFLCNEKNCNRGMSFVTREISESKGNAKERIQKDWRKKVHFWRFEISKSPVKHKSCFPRS